jgi:hypothetical protein
MFWNLTIVLISRKLEADGHGYDTGHLEGSKFVVKVLVSTTSNMLVGLANNNKASSCRRKDSDHH